MTSSSIPKDLILATIEEGIQKTLAMDSSTRNKLASMQDFTLQVTIKGFDFSFYVILRQGNVTLASYSEASIDCSLAGYPTQLFNMFSLSAEGKPVLDPAVAVEGNQDLPLQLYEIFRRAEPDYEAELARWLGPVAGHQVGRTLRSGARWFRNSTQSLATNFKSYIQEESRLFPHPLEVAQFYEEVSELEQEVADLATKVERLINTNPVEPAPNGQSRTQGDES